MKKRMHAAALLAALAWMSPAIAQGVPAVTVTLVGAEIRVDRDPIVVQRSMGQGIPIRWQLPPSADYSFDPTGIVVNGERIPGGGLRPQDQLPPSCNGGPKQVVCVNKNTQRGEFKYTIRLRDKAQNLIEKDPIIVNQ